METLRYYGGKPCGENSAPLGRWVLDLLPTEGVRRYVEPYGGMAGTLVNRPPAADEVYNDLDGRLVDWWRAVRETPDELARRLSATPWAEAEFRAAGAILETEGASQIDRAWAVAVRLAMGHVPHLRHDNGFLIPPAGDTKKRPQRIDGEGWITALSHRMRDVCLLDRDALRVIDRWKMDGEGTLIYVDPPYWGANTSAYSACLDGTAKDRCGNTKQKAAGSPEELMGHLEGATSRVAVSGYGTAYDALGWHRNELGTGSPFASADKRTEVLWTNYRCGQERLF